MSIVFSDEPYHRFLSSNKNKLFYSSPYPGNPGDMLICRATATILSDIGIAVTNIPDDADIILYPGGCPTMWQMVLDQIENGLKNGKLPEHPLSLLRKAYGIER